MNTPTPRTDAESFLSRGMGIVPTLPKEAVRIDFAKTLERELTAVTEQRDELAESLDFQFKLNRECIDQITTRTKERDEAREQRDRLAEEITQLKAQLTKTNYDNTK